MVHMETPYCQGCGAVLPIRANAGRIKCEFCGTVHIANTEQKRELGDLICPNCSFVNPQAAQYCGECGQPLYHTCPRCGTQNRMEIHYCFKCGENIEKTSKADERKDINIDDIYMDYLQESNRLWHEYSMLSGIPGAILVLVGLGAGLYYFVSTVLNSDNIGMGVLLALGFTLLGIIPVIILDATTMKMVKNKAVLIAKNKSGFDKFFNKFWGGKRVSTDFERTHPGTKDYWPQIVPEGIKRKEFLSMIGLK